MRSKLFLFGHVLLRFTASDYRFTILKLFLDKTRLMVQKPAVITVCKLLGISNNPETKFNKHVIQEVQHLIMST